MTLQATVAELDRATAHLDPPFAALHLPSLLANADDLVRRAHGTPIRLAAKSVRCRWVLEEVGRRSGFAGVMAFSLREALWLAENGAADVLVGYPSVDRAALRALGESGLADRVTLMVDAAEQVALVRGVTPAPLRLCLDIDASLRVGPLHLGVRRSPLRTPADAAALAREAVRLGFAVRGVMFYEAQVAGLPDTSAAVRLVKKRSLAELTRRRAAVVAAVAGVAGPVELVNSGGSGSVAESAADPCVTEVTAGSGLYAPTLFDGYRSFSPRPALFFALPVVRRPAPGLATLFGGGYVASGPAGSSRVPRPVWPPGLRLLPREGAGEVQTPVRGAELAVGDRVWFRHAKAGELLERFDAVHVVDGGGATAVASYRGEGRTFG
jgi:D-serine deaminase-like pyridoxal phosphate-dependent protein